FQRRVLPGPIREATPLTESKNGKKTERGGDGGGSKHSIITWFVVLALLGVWCSVAVVYFDIVDYDTVIARAKEFHMNFSEVLQGKLTAYDADGDGDFDVEDAKVLLGLSKDGGGRANADSLEEVLNILAEEGSDWIYGFFTFLYDVVSSPVEQGQEEKEAATDMQDEGDTTSSDDGEVKGVMLDLQNQ
uniref:Aspartyl beta-hydroxylase/Triadin domain-containing protein n=1 Tax=Mola mola TaxID=94237 RepID=A0A3Q3XM96_MOLML